MAGILNNKSRILDVVLTELGRQQMNRGEFEISFATFSDSNVRYEDAGDNILEDMKNELYFETFGCSSDEVVPEIDNFGDFLLTKQIAPTLTVKDGILYEKSVDGFNQVEGFANISKFTDLTVNRWKGLQLLETVHSIEEFTIDRESITLNASVSKNNLPKTVNLLNPILVDSRFSGAVNTMFLAPTVMQQGKEVSLKAYNEYSMPYTKENVLSEIQSKSRANARVKIGSPDTFEEYNIISQMYIGKNQSIKKYLVVDAGEFLNEEGIPTMQVYHLGLIYKDKYGTSKFSRGFSIVFHNEE